MSVRARTPGEALTRGWEILAHKATMRLSAEAIPTACAGAAYLIAAMVVWFALTGAATRTLTFESARTCAMASVLGGHKTVVRLRDGEGHLLTELKVDVRGRDGSVMVDWPTSSEACALLKSKSSIWQWIALLLAAATGLVAAYFAQRPVRAYCRRIGEEAGADQHLRGAQLATSEEIAEKVRNSRNGPGPYTFVGLPVENTLQMRNFAMMGAMGVGKSQAIENLVDQVRARGRRAIFYDHTGGMTAKYFRPGKDILLSPFDSRSPVWNVFAEVTKIPHFRMLGEIFIPPPIGNDGKYWSDSGQALFVDLCEMLKRRGASSSSELYAVVAKCGGPADLFKVLQGRESAKYVHPDGKYSADVLSNFSRSLTPLKYLEGTGVAFSIREWISRPAVDDDSCLFLTSSAEMHAAVMPLYAAFLNIAILALLNMPESPTEDRIWFFLDEVASMGPGVAACLEMLLTEGRKFGAVSVLGFQNDAQLEKNCGREGRRIIMSNLQNQLFMRVGDGETGKISSDTLGEAEIDEKSESLSFGAEPVRDGTSIATRRTDRRVATVSEITTLDDMVGFVKLAGAYPVVKVNFQHLFTKRPTIAPAYVERSGLVVEVDEELPAAGPEGAAEPADEPKLTGTAGSPPAEPDPWSAPAEPVVGPAILGDMRL